MNQTPNLSVNNTDTTVPYTELTAYKIGLAIDNYAHIITILVAFFGNIAALVTITRIKPISAVTISVAILAVADSVGVSVKFVYTKLTYGGVALGDFGCQAFNFLVSYCVDYANWVVVVMTVERFIAVWYPLQVARILTLRRVGISYCVLGLLLMPSSLCTFWIFEQIYYPGHGNICYHKPSMRDFEYTWNKVEFCIYVAIPCVLLIIVNSLLIYGMRVSSRNQIQAIGSGVQHSHRKLMERQLTVMLVSAALVFLVLMMPVGIFYLIRPHWNYKETENSKAAYYLIRSVVHLLADLNHAINFFVYFLSGTKFRRTFCSLFPCKPCSRDTKDARQTSQLSGGRATGSITTQHTRY